MEKINLHISRGFSNTLCCTCRFQNIIRTFLQISSGDSVRWSFKREGGSDSISRFRTAASFIEDLLFIPLIHDKNSNWYWVRRSNKCEGSGCPISKTVQPQLLNERRACSVSYGLCRPQHIRRREYNSQYHESIAHYIPPVVQFDTSESPRIAARVMMDIHLRICSRPHSIN